MMVAIKEDTHKEVHSFVGRAHTYMNNCNVVWVFERFLSCRDYKSIFLSMIFST